MTLMNVKTLMTGAGFLALTTGFAAAAPAMVESSVNLRSGPGIDHEVIGALPGGATVDVMGCRENWCRVNFDGTLGFVSRGYLGIGGVAMGPAYERSHAYGAYAPGYRYRGGYAPGYGESLSYRGEREVRSEREVRGERELRGERQLRGERELRGARAFRGEEERGQSRAAEIQGANPMLNPKNEAAAGANARAEGTRASERSNARSARGTQTATTGAGTGNNAQNQGPNFIGAGRKNVDNHP